MVAREAKLIKGIALSGNRAILPAEMPDRDFWIVMRRALLAQVDIIEKKFNLSPRCKRCGEKLAG